MDAQTISAAQGTSTAANTIEENPTPSRELLGKILVKTGGLSRDAIELQCRAPIQETARDAIELGMRLVLLKEMTPHGDWLPKLKLLGINDSVASRMMACAVRIADLPGSDRLIIAAQSKSKLFELLALEDSELADLCHGKAVRGVSLTTLPKTSVAVLRYTLKDNEPGKARAEEICQAKATVGDELAEKDKLIANLKPVVNDGFNAPIFVNPIAPVETDGTADNAPEFPAVYTLLPGDYNGWPISLIRHAGKTWLMASEVSAILAQDGDELDAIQGILDEWHRLGKPSDSSLEIRLASTATVVLIIDKLAVDLLNIRLNTPASAALAAWCADFDTPPALAEVKALHEAPAETTPDEALEELEEEYDRAHLMLHNLVAQIRGVHELAELSSGNQTKFPIRDMAGMLAVTRNQVEGYEQIFDSLEYGMMKIRRTLKRGASLPA